ncbi:MAG: ComEC/Rec2 family competence protein [Treponema sp.]|jgi:competence protein ComEC|nr:ComEC/Rec2 family competence protein [Treponema sp.]
MVKLKYPFPLSALTAGSVFSYYGVCLLNSRDLFGAFAFPWAFIAAVVILWSFFLALGAPFVLSGRPFRHIRILCASFALGLIVGAGLGAGVPGALSLGLPEERISALEGLVLEDPRALSGGNGMAALKLERTWGGRVRSSARGRVTVIFPGGRLEELKEFGRKSRVYLEGNFLPPRAGENGPGLFRAAAVHIISPAPPLEQFRTGLRRNLVSRFSRQENSSWGSLALALLLGVRDNLDSALAHSYREAGISHVLALSGMHLAVLSALIAFIFKPSLGQKGAAVLGAFLILAYVFLVGSQPSLDRAAIMYILGALAVIFSLARNPASILNLAFLIQILVRPEAGISISFILSYLALWGILHIGLKIAGLFRGKMPPFLLDPLAASLGAFIATSAVSAAGFGMLRPVGILAGLVIVPLTTLFMVLSLGYLALDLIFPLLARYLGMALSLLYKVLERLVAFSARAPGIVLENPGAFGFGAWVLALSVLLALLIFILAERRRLAISRIPPLP